MHKIFQNIKGNYTQKKEGGFLQLIVLIIVALLIMKFLNIPVSQVLEWIKYFFNWFIAFFKEILR